MEKSKPAFTPTGFLVIVFVFLILVLTAVFIVDGKSMMQAMPTATSTQ